MQFCTICQESEKFQFIGKALAFSGEEIYEIILLVARSGEHGVSCVAHDSFFKCVGSAELRAAAGGFFKRGEEQAENWFQ